MQAMPRPGRAPATHDEDDLAIALERSMADDACVAASCSPPLPQHGVSFASMTKMGFAAAGIGSLQAMYAP